MNTKILLPPSRRLAPRPNDDNNVNNINNNNNINSNNNNISDKAVS